MILIKPWHLAYPDALPVRMAVFVKEQGIPEVLEVDEFDTIADHALAYLDAQCVGTARLHRLTTKKAQIGRMAVLGPWRLQGIGKALLAALIKRGQSWGMSEFELHAQLSAIPFYEKMGFIPQGDEYHEAGILHRNMMLSLT